MIVLDTPDALRAWSCDRARSGAVALVPTMGALHAGHLSLVRAAQERTEHVVVSIFVNPLQFGPDEDLDVYPRTLEADLAALRAEGVAAVFTPDVAAMYPEGSTTTIDAGPVATRLDGASRPGHFTGVTTVVCKLLSTARPRWALFGQKDAAQVAVVSRMARDLDLGVEIVVGPIVREPDGLALSSRNVHLSPDERERALALHRSLRAMAEVATPGAWAVDVVARGRDVLAATPGVEIDYVAAVDPHTLLDVEQVAPGTLLAVAARVGATRLIDNVVV